MITVMGYKIGSLCFAKLRSHPLTPPFLTLQKNPCYSATCLCVDYAALGVKLLSYFSLSRSFPAEVKFAGSSRCRDVDVYMKVRFE